MNKNLKKKLNMFEGQTLERFFRKKKKKKKKQLS